MVRINRVYTRTGDKGKTGLVGGKRVAKDHPRIEAYGTVDELNATVGVARATLERSAAKGALDPILARVQNELFDLGAELATPDAARRKKVPAIAARHVTALEREMDAFNEDLPELRSFVLPGGGEAASALHVARTVCRRAERRAITLRAGGQVVPYLNRLSDALFVFSRVAAKLDGHPEPLWEPAKS